MKQIAIKSYRDQDQDRETIEGVVARQVADLMVMMDVVTSGGDGMDAFAVRDAAEFAAYSEFREWFAPAVAGSMLSGIGQILQASIVGEDGRVTVDSERLDSAVLRACATTIVGRLQWLVVEIPDLWRRHGQLYADEAQEALALCREVDALDIGTEEGMARAREAWPRLERLYQLAQRGSRLARGDSEAVEKRRADLERLEALIQTEEEAAARRHSAFASTPTGDADLVAALREGNRRLAELQDSQKQLARKRDGINRAIDATEERLAYLYELAAAAGVSIEDAP